MKRRNENSNSLLDRSYSRREFLATAGATPLLAAGFPERLPAANGVILSPDGRIKFELMLDEQAALSYRISFQNRPVVETSALGVSLDGASLTQGVAIGKIERYKRKERYAVRGVHSTALDLCNGAKFSLTQTERKIAYTLEARVFNDGAAFRFVITGDGTARTPDETTTFRLPAGGAVWFHDLEGHYEGVPVRKTIEGVKAGEWAAPPLTVKLPGGGYAAITEAALMNYAGMAFQADGNRGFAARLAHAQPESYPFRLRYPAEVERLKRPAAISGTITTPWRVVMIGADLNALVNCDIVSNVSPPPDKKLFPAGVKTEWLKPGRAVWKYLDGGENTLEEVKNFSKLAGELGFEYQVVEGFWSRWTEDQMRECVEYSRQQKVDLLFWKHSRDLHTAESRKEFFDLCRRVGVVGAKIDFLDHEAKEIIDLYQSLLREAAEHQLIIDFHGANKPAGEARTWPNEMTREGIFGMEHRKVEAWASINTTLPFTRMLAGHADYTPMLFGERRKETSWTHQIACAAILTSPLLIYGAHPKNILANPAVELIKSIPSVWDETIALPSSEIGELAVFARRNGSTWFLAILNGSAAREVQIPLAFLGAGKYQALFARDSQEDAAAVRIENTSVDRRERLTITLRAGGGFVGRFNSPK